MSQSYKPNKTQKDLDLFYLEPKNFGNSYPVSRGYNIPKNFFVGSQRILWKIFIKN